MPRERFTDRRAVAVDQIKDACWHTRLIHDLRVQISRQRGNLTGLQYHRTSHRQCRRDLATHLIQRPVPGRDQPADPDGLLDHPVWPQILAERIGLQDFSGLGNVAETRIGLRGAGQLDGGPHFKANRLCDLTNAPLKNLGHPLEHSDSLFDAGLAEGLKGRFRRRDSSIDVCLCPQRNRRTGFFCGRIQHFKRFWRDGVNPLTIDIELCVLAHDDLGY